jgi:glutathione S-transferase
MNEFIVHTIPGSPYARAVLVTLEEKRAPYRIAALAPGQHKAPEHLSRHPFGRMPVIEHGDFLLYETQAIQRYIDRAIPAPALSPQDPRALARMDQLMNISDWYLFQGVASVILFQRIVGPRILGLTPNETAIAIAMPQAHLAFAELARLLGDKPFFVSDAVSLADIMLAPQLDFFSMIPEWDALTAERPALRSWLARMNSRPSMVQTTWERVESMAKAA